MGASCSSAACVDPLGAEAAVQDYGEEGATRPPFRTALDYEIKEQQQHFTQLDYDLAFVNSPMVAPPYSTGPPAPAAPAHANAYYGESSE